MKTIIEKRCDDLYKLGLMFNFNHNSFIGKEDNLLDINVHVTEIQCDTEDLWNDKMSKIKKEIERRNQDNS